MGGCIGVSRSRSEPVEESSAAVSRPNSATNSGGTRKNHPLCHERIRWKSEVPLTEGQLRSKRDEFWDTAPAFDGRREVWDALRAAARAAEADDFALAQAILDGAGVSVPNGYLTECYDELGARYQLPLYCLSAPVNAPGERRSEGAGRGRDSPADCSEPADAGARLLLRLRLSSDARDLKLPAFSRDTVAHCKKKLQKQEGPDPSRQRWFYSGKLLDNKLVLEDAHITPGYVIQVIINTEELSDS